LASPGYTYAYDAENHHTAQTNTSTSAITSYSWDYHGRLTSTATGSSAVTYTYNAFDEKIGRQDSGSTAWYGLLGDTVGYEMNGSGTVTKRYLNGAGTDEVVAEDRGSGPRWAITDLRGSAAGL
jgi:YD repeat-containing protein